MNKATRLTSVMQKGSRRLIGLMSGMSMDGVDAACIDLSGDFPNLEFKLVGTHFLAYSAETKSRLISAQTGAVAEVSELNFVVANLFSQAVTELLSIHQIERQTVDAIGSHGQTIFHSTSRNDRIKSTLQIGFPSIIAEITGILTIGNFRVRDIAAGGAGAPLVSLADYILFRDPTRPVILNNLGSISNLTVVTPNLEDMLAFDTGPANMAIDFFARLIPGNTAGIDPAGALSSQGNSIPDLLNDLRADPFFREVPPKSAGYGEFGPSRVAELAKPYMNYESKDLLRTAVEFSASTIADAYKAFVFPRYGLVTRAIFSGGGIHNLFLMSRIKELLPQMRIESMPREMADAKEAIAFALLANETLSGRAGSLPSITGARQPTLLGEIAL